ncbi:MAG TPA: hypothetical protein VMT69_14005 [Kineosporiaceae bacterium]|nr:hypothetical protein [Kineosporiaceae bacterium]
MSPTSAALILSWACIVLLALATAGLLRRIDALERQIPAAGGLTGSTSTAGPHPGLRLALRRHLPDYLPDVVPGRRDLLLLIVSPSCGACRTALTDLAAAAPTGVDVLVATTAASLTPLELPPGFVGVPAAGGLIEVLDVPGTPYLMRLDAEGTVLRADIMTGATDLAAWTAPRTALPALTD